MISREDIGYEKIIEENIEVESICNDYSDYVLIFVKGSANPSTSEGYYLCVMNYKGNILTFEDTVNTNSVNGAMLMGVNEAIQHLKNGYKIMVVSSVLLGFQKGFNKKGPNGELVYSILEKIKEINCTLCECLYIGKRYKYDKYIMSFFKDSDIANKAIEKKIEKREKSKYYKELRDKVLYNKCLEDIINILEDNNVDDSILDLVKTLKR